MIFFLFFFDDDEGHNSIDDNDDDAFLVVEMTNSFLFNFNFKLHFCKEQFTNCNKEKWAILACFHCDMRINNTKRNQKK